MNLYRFEVLGNGIVSGITAGSIFFSNKRINKWDLARLKRFVATVQKGNFNHFRFDTFPSANLAVVKRVLVPLDKPFNQVKDRDSTLELLNLITSGSRLWLPRLLAEALSR